MRIEFKVEGGIAFFPGLSRPVVIDTDELPEEEAARLARLVGEASLPDLPPEVGASRPGAADGRTYEISVEGGRAVRVVEPVEDPGLRALVEALDARAKASRRATRAGGEDENTGE